MMRVPVPNEYIIARVMEGGICNSQQPTGENVICDLARFQLDLRGGG